MAYHTNEFLEARKDDPKWHEAYIERQQSLVHIAAQERAEKRYDRIMCVVFALGGAIVGATLGLIIGPILFP